MTEKKTVVYETPGIASDDVHIPEHIRATLKVASGINEGDVHQLGKAQTTIGRGELADVEVDESGRVWILAGDRVMLLEH